jgi:hypothetical protein
MIQIPNSPSLKWVTIWIESTEICYDNENIEIRDSNVGAMKNPDKSKEVRISGDK